METVNVERTPAADTPTTAKAHTGIVVVGAAVLGMLAVIAFTPNEYHLIGIRWTLRIILLTVIIVFLMWIVRKMIRLLYTMWLIAPAYLMLRVVEYGVMYAGMLVFTGSGQFPPSSAPAAGPAPMPEFLASGVATPLKSLIRLAIGDI